MNTPHRNAPRPGSLPVRSADADVACVHGWGRTASAVTHLVRPATRADVINLVAGAGPRGVTARGLGRSYGDAAQNSGGRTVQLTGLDRILDIHAGTVGDPADEPWVNAEAGVSLDVLMRVLLPLGLWIPVLPGTRQVTLGGAVAADVHGKNHHTQGSFGNHVRELDLLIADGSVRTIGPDQDPELFWATIGAMGLTGITLRVRLALQRVGSAYFSVDTDRCTDLDDLMTRMSHGDEHYTYSVAWFDAVTTGKHLGRAVLTRGDKAPIDALPQRLRRDPLRFAAPALGTIPPVFPNRLINPATVRAFSEAWLRKAPKHRVGEIQNITQFFHPLDVAQDWNRVYGPAGFLQYQCVVPFTADVTFRRVVETIVRSGHPSFLNVLKRFGAGNAAPLSFPMPGWTVTVDLPIAEGLDRLCIDLDELVLGAEGRSYLAKDSRLDAATFARMYPRLTDFRRVRQQVDPERRFTSDLARRLHL